MFKNGFHYLLGAMFIAGTIGLIGTYFFGFWFLLPSFIIGYFAGDIAQKLWQASLEKPEIYECDVCGKDMTASELREESGFCSTCGNDKFTEVE